MLVWGNMGRDSSVDKIRHHPNTNKDRVSKYLIQHPGKISNENILPGSSLQGLGRNITKLKGARYKIILYNKTGFKMLRSVNYAFVVIRNFRQ